MATGDTYLNIMSKKILGVSDLTTRFFNYMQEKSNDTTKYTYGTRFFIPDGITITADGNDKFKLTKDASDVIGADGLGNYLDIDSATKTGIQFENTNITDYYIGLKYCYRPVGIQVNPRNGNPEYTSFQEQIGERNNPGTVNDNGDDTITLIVDSVTEPSVDNTGRQVLVYMVVPAQGATTEAIAIEQCTVFYAGGNNKITTVDNLGQTTISTTSTDYEVVLLGPTVKKNTDLRTEDDYAFVGIVTGAGSGSPPTVFDHADQKVLSASWAEQLILGYVQDMFPKVDNTYSLGTASLRWSDIHAYDLTIHNSLIIDGDLLPADDDTHDIGSGTYQWKDLYINGIAYIDILSLSAAAGEGVTTDFVPSGGNYDLGNATYKWMHLYIDGTAYMDALILSAVAGEGVSSDFVPSIDDYYDLGNNDYQWKDLYINGTAYIDTLELSIINGEGVGSDILPTDGDTYSLGSSSYQWKDLHIDGIGYIDILTLGTVPGSEGVNTIVLPVITDTYDLGNATYQWAESYILTGYFNALDTTRGGNGGDPWIDIKCELVPDIDDTYNLGSSSYRWRNFYVDGTIYTDKLDLSTIAGEGIDDDFVPTANGTHDIGNSDYRFADGYFSGIVNVGSIVMSNCGSSLIPSTDDTYNLGSATYQWKDLYINGIAYVDILNLSTANGEGVTTDIIPVSDDDYHIGSSSYGFEDAHFGGRVTIYEADVSTFVDDVIPTTDDAYSLGNIVRHWEDLHISNVANIVKLKIGTSTLEGLDSSLYPTTSDSFNIGSATKYYNDGYFDNLYYKTTGTFDNHDDLSLIEKFKSKNELVKVKKGGKTREIQKGDLSSLPWPMLGPKDPETGDYFLDLADSTTFLLGAIKQLYGKHKEEIGELKRIIEEQNKRLNKIEEIKA